MSFDADNAWQRGVRNRILVPLFYRKHSADGRYVFLDKGRIADVLQRKHEVDTIIQSRDGGVVAVEEKIVRWKGKVYDKFFLETKSCTNVGHESDGWMVYGSADYLFYCFSRDERDSALDCYLVDFQKLKEWFWPRCERWSEFVMPFTPNHTAGRLTPIAEVVAEVPSWRFELRAPDAPALATPPAP